MHASLWEVCDSQGRFKTVKPDRSRILAERAKEQERDPEGFGSETAQDIVEIFALEEGYDKRRDAFFALPKATVKELKDRKVGL